MLKTQKQSLETDVKIAKNLLKQMLKTPKYSLKTDVKNIKTIP